MTILAQRGTKRTCQDESCAKRFYDLNRASIECPYCGASYVPVAVVISTRAVYSKRPQYKLQKGPEDIVAPVAAIEPTDDEAPEDVVEEEADDDTAEAGLAILEIDEADESAEDIIDPGIAKEENG